MTLRLALPLRSLAASALLGLAALACSSGGGDDGDAPDGGGTGGTDGDVGSGGLAGTGGLIGGTGGTPDPGDYIFPEGRGPTVTFTTYEAEDMTTTGQLMGPTVEFGQVAAEASGRRSVRLDAAEESVSFVNKFASNSVVIRYSIPDNGENYWKKLSVLVDGVERVKVDVTSRYSWSYRNDDDDIFNTPDQNNPAAGTAHHFFDETRAIIGDVAAGATITIKHPGGADGAPYYDIDLVETELVPAALPKPDNYKSIVDDCGATNNGDADDDTAAIQYCLDNPGGGVYIPEGVFYVKNGTGTPLQVNLSVSIRGAGMWRSTIMGYDARFTCGNGDCKYYDFAVFGDTTARKDDAPDAAFDGGDNNNVVLDNIWIEHRRVGYWTNGGGANIAIRNSRMRNLHADAVNFYGGVTGSVVENCHVRNTGDDGLAAWSHDIKPVNSGNAFKHNYVQIPWKANCIAIYGGDDMAVEDNVCADTLQQGGILVANAFDCRVFGGTHTYDRNTLLRAGGIAYGQPQGAFILEPRQGSIANIHVSELDIIDATHFGIHALGGWNTGYNVSSTYFTDVLIQKPVDAGIFLPASANGAMDMTNVVVTGVVAGDQFGLVDDGGNQFTIVKGTGNTGW